MISSSSMSSTERKGDPVEPQLCVQCGAKVQGELEGISLSICCLRCCRKYVAVQEGRYAGAHRVSRKHAWLSFDVIHPNSFDRICGLEYNEGWRLTLYLGAEARYIGERARINREEGAAEKIRDKIKARFGNNVMNYDSYLMTVLLKDYADCCLHENLIYDPQFNKRLSVLERAVTIRSACKDATPNAIFDFCVVNKEGTVDDFLALRNTIKKVFKEEGHRIMKYLTMSDQQKLMGTPLEDVVVSFQQRNKRAAIYALLQDWTGDNIATAIINDPACQPRIMSIENDAEIAKKLLSFWETKDDISTRTNILSLAYDSIGELWDFRKPYKMFVNGEVDCDPEEIIGVCMISSAKIGRPKYRRERKYVALSEFEKLWNSEKVDVKGCVQAAIQRSLQVLPNILDCTSSWDYKELTKGFWKQHLLS